MKNVSIKISFRGMAILLGMALTFFGGLPAQAYALDPPMPRTGDKPPGPPAKRVLDPSDEAKPVEKTEIKVPS